LLGASGFLGSYIFKRLYLQEKNIIRQSRKKRKNFIKIDLLNKREVFKKLKKINPKIIINTSGMTDVEKCENSFHLAFKSNVVSIQNVCEYVKTYNKNCYFINISTDHLYNGKGPHKEENINLINNYALTKYLGEVMSSKIDSINLRVNFFGNNFIKKTGLVNWFINACKRKKKIFLYKDILFSPLEINSLTEIISKIINKRISGTYNLGSNNGISKAEFLNLIGKNLKLNLKFAKITSSSNIKNRAKRPNDMRLNNKKFEKKFKIKLPNIYQEIQKFCINYNNY
tara:strand:+ start:1262 stop:2116 length:855 start_codon:yes stop_codon:yes gene_type:complete